MRNKMLIAILITLLLLIGSIVLIVMSFADDEKLKDALREAGIDEVSQEVYTDRSIARGQVITEQDVYENQIPVDEARAEAFLCKEDVIGKRTVGAMEPDQPLTVQDLGLRKEDVLKNEIERLKKRRPRSNEVCSHLADTKVRIPVKFLYRATRDIPEGERIKESDIETIPVAEHNTKNCIGDVRLAVNHMAKYGIEKDQFLYHHYLVTVGIEEEDAFVATRGLKPGEVVKPDDVAKKHLEKNMCSANAILEENLITGSIVVQPIAKDQVFRVIDLQASTEK